MAKGVEDSAYYRWARFVALNEVGGDPARFGSTVAEFHAAQQRRAERYAGVDDDAVDARHQAQRGRAGPAGRAGRAARPSGRSWCAAGWPGTRWPTGRWRTWSGRTWSARGRCRASGRTPTWRRRPARPAPRRRGPTPDEEFEGRLHALVDAAFDDPATSRGDRRVRRPDRAVRLVELAVAEAAAADDARRPRRLPGHRAVGLLPGRPGQPPAGRLRAAPRAAGRAGRRRRCRPSTRPAPPSCSSSRARCGPGATTRSGSPGTSRWRSPARRADHVVAFDRGGVVAGGDPAAGGAGRATAGATPRCSCPTAPWRDLLTGERVVSDVAGIAGGRAAHPPAGGAARPGVTACCGPLRRRRLRR